MTPRQSDEFSKEYAEGSLESILQRGVFIRGDDAEFLCQHLCSADGKSSRKNVKATLEYDDRNKKQKNGHHRAPEEFDSSLSQTENEVGGMNRG